MKQKKRKLKKIIKYVPDDFNENNENACLTDDMGQFVNREQLLIA